MRDPFEGRVAVITGGASGIGRAVGEALIARRARVVLADLSEAVHGVARELGAESQGVDVRDAGAMEALVAGVVERHGRLDLMFNNAGIGVGGEIRDQTLDHWLEVLDVNLRGVVHGVRAAYPRMIEQGFGHVVNTASVAGLIPVPQLAPYSASKHAVVALTGALRIEARRYGVKASVVCPGVVRTPILETARFVGEEAARRELLNEWPFGVVEPADAAEEILRGVAENRAFIVFPRSARWLWRLYRRMPQRMLDGMARLAELRFGRG